MAIAEEKKKDAKVANKDFTGFVNLRRTDVTTGKIVQKIWEINKGP